MVFSKRLKKSLNVYRFTVGKPHNSYATQLVNLIVFESYYCENPSKIAKKI